MFYTLPPQLDLEITELEQKIEETLSGRMKPEELKAHRVPFGVYEQRTAHTYMMRVRCPGGAITPAQLRLVAQLALKYGAPVVHITTRQELQLHDILLPDIIPIMRALKAAGLSTRGGGGNSVRNIVASPSAGADPVEFFDISSCVFALTSRLLSESDSWLLPRKFKIGFSNTEEDSAQAACQDAGFVATAQNGDPGFKVYLAGGLGAKPAAGKKVHDFIPAGEVYIVAEAVKRLYNRLGNRRNKHHNRLRFLWQDLGEQEFLRQYRLFEKEVRSENPAPLMWKAAAPDHERSLPASFNATGKDFDQWKERYALPHRQSGLKQVLLPVVHGNLPARQAIQLADFMESFGPDTLRGTREQNFLLRHIPESHLGNVFALVKEWNPLVGSAPFLGRAVVCTGASTCKLGICLPRPAMDAIVERIGKTGLPLDDLGTIQMNISGCPNSCGNHWTADFGFYGRASHKGGRMYPAYTVVAGGNVSHGTITLGKKAGEVAAKNLPELVCRFLETYAAKKSRFSLFRDYLEKEGFDDLASLCRLYEKPPEFAQDPAMYTDWGEGEPLSIASRGQGECAAGLFDLIEFDLRQAHEHWNALKSEATDDRRRELLYQTTLLSARALLITRGAESHTEEEVLALFIKHFVNSGLVASRFLPLLEAARSGDRAALSRWEQEVQELLDAVDGLYRIMDDSFHFKTDSAVRMPASSEAEEFGEQRQSIVKDLRKVACPMNFVKTKIVLDGMTAGQRLLILLDDGAPIQNVPRSIQAEGHKILQQTKKGDHWSVLIEKG